MRKAMIQRKTAETDISLTLILEGSGHAQVTSGVPFLDHMLTLFARHGRFDLTLTCTGDIDVDAHHTTEDIGICLGLAVADALGDLRGVRRYGQMLLPMDESLILTAIDLSGRSYLGFDANLPANKIGNFDSELAEEFFAAFVRHAKVTLHIRQLTGKNTHHIIEGMFKSFARALAEAVSVDPATADAIPSTKGMLV